MPRSNFKNGFRDGFSVRGVAMQVPHTGKTFYVNASTTAAEVQPLGIGGSNSNDGLSPERPLSTILAAKNKCNAGRGDTIYVMAGHTESIANATSLVLDVSGVKVIGLGTGEKRPVITFATATTANIPVSGANTSISGLVFKCDIASQVAMVTVTGKDVEIYDCSFREGAETGLNFITIGAADNDADRCYIHDCDFYMPTAGNGDHAIEFLKDMVNVRIEDCDIDGDFDEGGILIPTAGDAQVNLRIRNCNIKNRLTNVAAIDIDGTASSGLIQNCLLRTDTQSTALDSGSLAVDNVKWADETDQVSSTSVLAPVDSVSNAIGVDDADNAFASTNVVANKDGSVLERLEYIQTEATAQVPATFVPGLGYRVIKTENVNTATGVNLFTVTGKVLVTLWTMEVTNALDAAVIDYKLSLTTSNGEPLAAGNISSAAVGHMFQLTTDSDDTALNTSSGAVSITGMADTNGKGIAMRVIGLASGSDTLKSVRTAGAAGDEIKHILFYLPLEASATVVAA